MKVLAIVQNLFGFGGDSVNEKQLLKNLCKYAYKCIIISPIQTSKIFKIRLRRLRSLVQRTLFMFLMVWILEGLIR
jgi:FAD synthase